MRDGEKIPDSNINKINKHNYFNAIDANQIADMFNSFINAITYSTSIDINNNIINVNCPGFIDNKTIISYNNKLSTNLDNDTIHYDLKKNGICVNKQNVLCSEGIYNSNVLSFEYTDGIQYINLKFDPIFFKSDSNILSVTDNVVISEFIQNSNTLKFKRDSKNKIKSLEVNLDEIADNETIINKNENLTINFDRILDNDTLTVTNSTISVKSLSLIDNNTLTLNPNNKISVDLISIVDNDTLIVDKNNKLSVDPEKIRSKLPVRIYFSIHWICRITRCIAFRWKYL